MTTKSVAAQVYALCADTVRGEIESARRSVERLSEHRLPTAPEQAAIKRLTRILTKFERLADE